MLDTMETEERDQSKSEYLKKDNLLLQADGLLSEPTTKDLLSEEDQLS